MRFDLLSSLRLRQVASPSPCACWARSLLRTSAGRARANGRVPGLANCPDCHAAPASNQEASRGEPPSYLSLSLLSHGGYEHATPVVRLVPTAPPKLLSVNNHAVNHALTPRSRVTSASSRASLPYVHTKRTYYVICIEYNQVISDPVHTLTHPIQNQRHDAMRHSILFDRATRYYALPGQNLLLSQPVKKSSLRIPLRSHMPLKIPPWSYRLTGLSSSAIIPASMTQMRS